MSINVETYLVICFVHDMFDQVETINWPTLVRSYGMAERALGDLAHALRATTLHSSWLWRELTRVSVTLAHIRSYRVQVDQVQMALAGVPLDRDDHEPGVAAARRVFLAAAPLFRNMSQTESPGALWPQVDNVEVPTEANPAKNGQDTHDDAKRAGEAERARLLSMVRELVAFADDGRRPTLINLLVDLRKQARATSQERLPTTLVRIALPLALQEAGLVPKAAPGLIGGPRLSLGMSRASDVEPPLTEWLRHSLQGVTVDAERACTRLWDLTQQFGAWHEAIAAAGLRRHAKAPRALDLLAVTPVVTIGLIARHLKCSHVAAGKIAEGLVDLGILIETTSRSRHKIFAAADLARDFARDHDQWRAAATPLSFSKPLRPVDVEALEETLDDIFADLDQKSARTKATVKEANERHADPS